MSQKPSLTRALDTAADIARQIGRDPAVKEATADLLERTGRTLAAKFDHGATQLRARPPGDAPVGQPAPSLRKSACRVGVGVGVALADAMMRSSVSREKAARPAARPKAHHPGGIEQEILQHAEAAYQRVLARFDEPEDVSVRHDPTESSAEAGEDARAPTRLVADTDTTADTLTQPADEAERHEPASDDPLPPGISAEDAAEDARAWAQVGAQASALLASAIGAPVGGSQAARDRHAELSGDDHWPAELR